MSSAGPAHRARLAGGLILLAALGALAVLLSPLMGRVAGVEAEVVTALKGVEPAGVDVALPGLPEARLTAPRVHFGRLTVKVAPGGRAAEALSTLDLEGRVGEVAVSALGVEVTPFRLEAGRWRPARGPVPRLAAALAALERRRRALAAQDAAALGALGLPPPAGAGPATPRAWLLRLEHDGATVNERLAGPAGAPPREVRLVLTRRGEEFIFSPAVR